MADVATSRAGKPVNNSDQVTIVGNVTNISGTGLTATITVKCAFSGNSISVQAGDLYNAQTS